MPITSGLPNRAGLGSRSATNAQCRCAGHIIASFIGRVSKRSGGRERESNQAVIARKLWTETHPLRDSVVVVDHKGTSANGDAVVDLTNPTHRPK
jgi:hypothetical protein